jgi:hypothetical protein
LDQIERKLFEVGEVDKPVLESRGLAFWKTAKGANEVKHAARRMIW